MKTIKTANDQEEIEKASKKKKSGQPKNYYFSEAEEVAVKDFLMSEDYTEKEKIFNERLLPAFKKMTESIIRRYKLYPPDETYQETFDDTMSFLMMKLQLFRADKGYKAYSYCGTIIKRYLIYKINTFYKNQKRSSSYDAMDVNEMHYLTDTLKYSYKDNDDNISTLRELMENTARDIGKMINSGVNGNPLNESQKKVGLALIEILTNWEELFAQMGSNKFNKSSILLFIKEMTMMTTKEIREAMKLFKDQYYFLKDESMEEHSSIF